MTKLPASQNARGLSLLELLIIVALVAMLAAMLLPVLSNGKPAYLVLCMQSQKVILFEESRWQTDHDGQVLWQISTRSSWSAATLITNVASAHFRWLSNNVSDPKRFVCPTDRGRRSAIDTAVLADTNLSYFVNLVAVPNRSDSIVIGDRHLKVSGYPAGSKVISLATNDLMEWTKELHGKSRRAYGVLGFADGHVERVMSDSLNKAFRQNVGTALFAIP